MMTMEWSTRAQGVEEDGLGRKIRHSMKSSER